MNKPKLDIPATTPSSTRSVRSAALGVPDQSRRASMTNIPSARKQGPQSRRASWAGSEKKSVTFSEYSEMTLIQFPTERENHAKWYTDENMRRFRRVMLREAEMQSNEYLKAKEENPDKALSKEELIKYIGLVHLLSDDVIQRSQEVTLARKLHAYTVLKEQKTQRKHGASCKLKLARVSSMSSLDARERACNMAELFMRVDDRDI